MLLVQLWYFNSIKVRLELQGSSDHLQLKKFQFHKGTIRTDYLTPSSDMDFNFNSIKVRLELKQPAAYYPIRLFQFHKGTIRT